MTSPDSAHKQQQHRPLPHAPWAPSDASAASAPTAYQWTQEELDHYRNTHNRVKIWRQDAFTGRTAGRSVGAGSAAWSSTDSDVSVTAPRPQYRHPLSSHPSNPPPRGAELEAVMAMQQRARDASTKIQRSLSKRTPMDPAPSSVHPSATRPAPLSRSQSRRSTPAAVLAQAPSSPLPQNIALPRSDHLPLSSAPTAPWSQREAYLNDALSAPLEFLSETLPDDPMHATTERPSGLTRVGSFLSRTKSTVSRRGSQESLAKAPPPSAFPPAASRPPQVLVATRSNSVSQAHRSSQTGKLARCQSSSAASKNNRNPELAQQPNPPGAGGNNSAPSKVSATAAAPVLPELSFDPILATQQIVGQSAASAGHRTRSRSRAISAHPPGTVSKVSAATQRTVGATARAQRTDDTLLLATQHALPRTATNPSSVLHVSSHFATKHTSNPNSIAAKRVPLSPSTIVSTTYPQPCADNPAPPSPPTVLPAIPEQLLLNTIPRATSSTSARATQSHQDARHLSPHPPTVTPMIAPQVNLPPLPPSTTTISGRPASSSPGPRSPGPSRVHQPALPRTSVVADHEKRTASRAPSVIHFEYSPSRPPPDLSCSPSEDSDDDMTFPDFLSSPSSQHRAPAPTGRHTAREQTSTPRHVEADLRRLASVDDLHDPPTGRPGLKHSHSDGPVAIKPMSRLHVPGAIASRAPTHVLPRPSMDRRPTSDMGRVSLRVSEVGVGIEADKALRAHQASFPISKFEHDAEHVSFELPSETRGRLHVSLSWVPPALNAKAERHSYTGDAAVDKTRYEKRKSPKSPKSPPRPLPSVLDDMRSPAVSSRTAGARAGVDASKVSGEQHSASRRKPQNWYMDAQPHVPSLTPMPVATPILHAVPIQPVVPVIPVHYAHWGFPPTPPASPFFAYGHGSFVDLSQVAYGYAPMSSSQYLAPPVVAGAGGLGRRSSMSRVSDVERTEYEKEKAERRRQRSARREAEQSQHGPAPAAVKTKSAGQAGGKTEAKSGSGNR